MSLRPNYERLRKILKDCEGYKILVDNDVVQLGDETGFASSLMASLDGYEGWRVMDAKWAYFFGKTVDDLNDPAKNDEMDAQERLFRRKAR